MKIRIAYLKVVLGMTQASNKLDIDGQEGIEALTLIPEGLLVEQKNHPSIVVPDSNVVGMVPVEQDPAQLKGSARSPSPAAPEQPKPSPIPAPCNPAKRGPGRPKGSRSKK